ncbi:MAG: rhomboid family intramembrane serine protease [Methylococcaceae bacterium]|jgi:membrane associated rhomboid family serine protease|nr:rhomboid family intramembrane serine protease [Methylococcaceae bacterium]
MIPFRDTVPLQYTPWVTWTLILVNTLIFLAGQAMDPDHLRSFQYLHGLVPARFTYPEWAAMAGLPVDYTPFVTSMFLHGGWLHLIFNMWLLWIFGDNIEDRMGGVRFLAFYLFCGLIAGLTQLYANPLSTIPTIGASGGIAGIMGAYFFLFPYARIVIWVLFLPIFLEVPAIAFLGIWVIVQLFKVTTGMGAVSGGNDVAWFGHLGGFLAGMFLYRPFLLRERSRGGDKYRF